MLSHSKIKNLDFLSLNGKLSHLLIEFSLKMVKEFIEGFESPYGLELLATVDYISQSESIDDTNEIINKIEKWTKRKKEIMKPYHIQVGHERLKEYYRKQYI